MNSCESQMPTNYSGWLILIRGQKGPEFGGAFVLWEACRHTRKRSPMNLCGWKQLSIHVWRGISLN